MKYVYIITAAIYVSSVIGCTSLRDPYASVKDEKAKVVLQKAVTAYGGLDKWESISYMSFNKWYALYDAEGAEEVNLNQEHHYTPQKIYMTWTEGQDKIEQSKVGNLYSKSKNGMSDTDAIQSSIRNSILASTFVVNVPFNLLDFSAKLSYGGETTFNNKEVYIIKAEYFPETQKHHTTKDIWWHYFDKNSYISQGYKVKHLDHVSLVENQEFTTHKGFTLPTTRASYRVDESGEKLYLRAEYKYSDYKITF